MPITHEAVLTLFSGLAFLGYGILCLTTDHMIVEFTRYGLLPYRMITGVLEALGGLGSLVGFFYFKPIYLLSTGGLAVLMLMGVIVRMRIKDPFMLIIPAMVLMLINGYLFYRQVSN
jgi:hypothetical protein